MSKSIFGHLPDGTLVHRYTLSNRSGMQVSVIDYGAIITEINVPDGSGRPSNMVLHYDNLDDYLNGTSYLGTAVGRVANRIAKGSFSLDGQTFTLATNGGPNHLHGGEQGFDSRLWQAQLEGEQTISFKLKSINGDQGYPGALEVEVRYTLKDDNTLAINYHALCRESATPVNLTQHTYFNLSGQHGTDIGQHSLQLFCQEYTPMDKTGVPTGQVASVKGTALDFSEPTMLNDVLFDNLPAELDVTLGIDHNFVIPAASGGLAKVACLKETQSGRSMEVFSSQPGVQVYTGNYLDVDGAKDSKAFKRHEGLCLECQSFPDSVNQPSFPSIIIQPGEEYRETTCYQFHW